MLVTRLGLPFEAIDLVQGDSDQLIAGGGTGGSRSIMASGKALVEAAAEVIEKGRALAGHVLEAAAADIVFERGAFRIAGTDRAIGLLELAAQVRLTTDLPAGLPDSLDAALVSDSPPSAFPNGCHIAEVEIDPETGAVALERYVAVDDFGTLVNPMLAEGQVHGGVAQGIGQALMEQAVYDGAGQLLTGSFMDYCLPRADRVPAFEVGLPSGAGDQQPARRQGLRRGRRDRRPAGGDERGGRCAGRARRHATSTCRRRPRASGRRCRVRRPDAPRCVASGAACARVPCRRLGDRLHGW